jgi:signal transduction histidine kinase
MSSELEMLEREKDLSRVHQSVGVLQGQIARITRSLHEMNDFARRRGDEVTTIPVQLAVEDAMRMVRHDPRARKLKLIVELSEELPSLRGVDDHLVMVLVNLVINAFDSIVGEGTVIVRARPEGGGGLVIEVCDDGRGMTEEVRARALEPLFTTKEPGRGTGLGLSVSSDVVKSMGGALTLESSPGVGTTVRLSFPRTAVISELGSVRKAVARG